MDNQFEEDGIGFFEDVESFEEDEDELDYPEITSEYKEDINFDIKFRLYEIDERRKKINREVDKLIKLIQNDSDCELSFATEETYESAPIKVPKICRSKKLGFLDQDIKVIGSIGYTYVDEAFDPTVTEAFDTGFYAAIRMIEEGLIAMPIVKITSEISEL